MKQPAFSQRYFRHLTAAHRYNCRCNHRYSHRCVS